MWCQLVVQPVAAQERNRNDLTAGRALVVQYRDRRRGVTPRCRDVQRRNLREARELSKPSATDNGNTDRVYATQLCISLQSSVYILISWR